MCEEFKEFNDIWGNNLWDDKKRNYFSSLEKDYEETYGQMEDNFDESMFECDEKYTKDEEDEENETPEEEFVFSVKSQSRRMLDARNWVALFSRNGETPRVNYLRYSHATNFEPISYDLFLTIL